MSNCHLSNCCLSNCRLSICRLSICRLSNFCLLIVVYQIVVSQIVVSQIVVSQIVVSQIVVSQIVVSLKLSSFKLSSFKLSSFKLSSLKLSSLKLSSLKLSFAKMSLVKFSCRHPRMEDLTTPAPYGWNKRLNSFWALKLFCWPIYSKNEFDIAQHLLTQIRIDPKLFQKVSYNAVGHQIHFPCKKKLKSFQNGYVVLFCCMEKSSGIYPSSGQRMCDP
jgi:hypothetical protein